MMFTNVYVVCENSTDTDLQKEEYIRQAKVIIGNLSYKIVDDIKEADYLMYFNYDTAEHSYQASRPVYNYSAPQSFNYSQSTYGVNGYSNSYGTVQQTGPGALTYAGQRSWTEKYYISRLQFAGIKISDVKYENGKPKMPIPIFETVAVTSSDSYAQRDLMPYLMIAARNQLGLNKREAASQSFIVNDPSVVELIEKSGVYQDTRGPATLTAP